MINILDLQHLADYYVRCIKLQHRQIRWHKIQFPTSTRKTKACHFQYSIAHHHNNKPLICFRRSWFKKATDIEKVDTLAHELAHIFAHTHNSKKFNAEYRYALILLSSYLV